MCSVSQPAVWAMTPGLWAHIAGMPGLVSHCWHAACNTHFPAHRPESVFAGIDAFAVTNRLPQINANRALEQRLPSRPAHISTSFTLRTDHLRNVLTHNGDEVLEYIEDDVKAGDTQGETVSGAAT